MIGINGSMSDCNLIIQGMKVNSGFSICNTILVDYLEKIGGMLGAVTTTV